MLNTQNISENNINRIISETVRRNLLEVKANAIIREEQNPAYNRPPKNPDDDEIPIPSLRKLWSAIEKKQKTLQQQVFGNLSNGIMDIVDEKAKSMGNEYLHVPYTVCKAGNSKLPPNVLIVNMSSSLMCPSFYLGICTITSGYCYAQSEENRHSARNNYSVYTNRRQTDLMHTQMLQQYERGNKEPMKEYFRLVEEYIQLGNAYAADLTRHMIEDIEFRTGRKISKEEKNILRLAYDKYKITDVRLNETGDFHCQLAVDLWADFAEKIKRKYGINTHAYTARNLDFSRASQVMAINASHNGINVGNSIERKFKAVDDDFYDSLEGGNQVVNRQPVLAYNGRIYYYKCPCGDNDSKCNRCGVCFEQNKTGKPYTIFVRQHGTLYADGLKNLFKKSEVEKVIEKLYQNGWITEEEYAVWRSDRQQNFLNGLDKKIDTMRKKSDMEKNRQKTNKQNVKIKNKK